MKKDILNFIKHVRLGYLLFTSLIILGIAYGLSEIVQLVFLQNTSQETLQILYFSRGIIVSLTLMFWAAWTVYNYRSLYQEKLDVAEKRYRNIIEHSADAIISLDNDDYITSWNTGAEQIFGWQREEIIGKPVTVIIPDELIEKKELECLRSGMTYRGYVTNYRTERLTNKGTRILVTLTESYIRDENDEIVGRSQILRDLTDLKIREEQVQHSERLATVGHMAAGVAHEVGNPLTAISSLVQVCQRKTDDPFVQDQLGKVRDHIQRITKIVRDLVDFSRPSSLQTETISLNEIVKAAVGLLKHDARYRNVNFDLQLATDIPQINAVPDHLHQVIVNLLLNAVDAMQNIENPKITIQTQRQNQQILLIVSDVGKGIPADVQDRIFEPFYTTKDVGKGTGLGLSVSHGIITKMGGTIDVESEVDRGTTFTITLPLEEISL